MCGITGIVSYNTSRTPDKNLLIRMTNTLIHRGPDSLGVYQDKYVALGIRRLAIIDLFTGNQPISNEDKSIITVFNGEIYNFRDLKQELINDKHVFRTKTDTEVLVHLYEEYGENMLQHMDGMFAFALYDKKKQLVLLARDRLGKKPLYITDHQGQIIFSSEIKSILKHPDIKRRINTASFYEYLVYDYVPSPNTIFKKIYKLPAGTFLKIQPRKTVQKNYWQIKFSSSSMSYDEALDRLDKLLTDSVKIRLISDVPLGVFLSGGIDSTTICYYANQFSKRPIHTYSIGFSEKSFDESDYSTQAAKFLGTDHHHETLTSLKCKYLLNDFIETIDEPVADFSIIPTMYLSKVTRKHVTVALSGDGGDELFAGYSTFIPRIIEPVFELFSPFLNSIFFSRLCEKAPVDPSLKYMLKAFINGLKFPRHLRDPIWIGSFGGKLNKLLNLNMFKIPSYQTILSSSQKTLNQFNTFNLYQQISALYFKQYLTDDILFKVDRASMRYSLEVRCPFLDYRLVDFIFSLPISYRLKGFTTKYLLRNLMQNRIPKIIINRAKQGFGILGTPINDWIRTDWYKLIKLAFSSNQNLSESIFDNNYINQLLENHHQGKADNRKEIWSIYTFLRWKDYWQAYF